VSVRLVKGKIRIIEELRHGPHTCNRTRTMFHLDPVTADDLLQYVKAVESDCKDIQPKADARDKAILSYKRAARELREHGYVKQRNAFVVHLSSSEDETTKGGGMRGFSIGKSDGDVAPFECACELKKAITFILQTDQRKGCPTRGAWKSRNGQR
ncbi:hypothetical protein PMAYCL1PPCAC_24753, partial [Pristionchus mayeri]